MSDALFEDPPPTEQAPTALARKWRPRQFSAVVGQDHAVRALQHALETGRLHHAYLLTGSRGVGKTTLARILAKALNCESGVVREPCGGCANCLAIDRGRFVDYIEIDAASNRGVEEIQHLLEQARFAPTSGRFKVYVIDEVHMLSKTAFNAMLKTLEEPPADVKFVLATTDPQKIPVTVLSRCLQFSLKNLRREALVSHLTHVLAAESVAADPEALMAIANAAQGSVRDALSLADQAIAFGGGSLSESSVSEMLGLVQRESLLSLAHAIATSDAAAAIGQLDHVLESGGAADAILADLARLFHEVSATHVLKAEALDRADQGLAALVADMDPQSAQLAYQIVVLGRRDLGLAPDERTGLEMTILRLLAFRPEVVEAVAPPAVRAAPLRVASSAAPPCVCPQCGCGGCGGGKGRGTISQVGRPHPPILARSCQAARGQWPDSTVFAAVGLRGSRPRPAAAAEVSGSPRHPIGAGIDHPRDQIVVGCLGREDSARCRGARAGCYHSGSKGRRPG